MQQMLLRKRGRVSVFGCVRRQVLSRPRMSWPLRDFRVWLPIALVICSIMGWQDAHGEPGRGWGSGGMIDRYSRVKSHFDFNGELRAVMPCVRQSIFVIHPPPYVYVSIRFDTVVILECFKNFFHRDNGPSASDFIVRPNGASLRLTSVIARPIYFWKCKVVPENAGVYNPTTVCETLCSSDWSSIPNDWYKMPVGNVAASIVRPKEVGSNFCDDRSDSAFKGKPRNGGLAFSGICLFKCRFCCDFGSSYRSSHIGSLILGRFPELFRGQPQSESEASNRDTRQSGNHPVVFAGGLTNAGGMQFQPNDRTDENGAFLLKGFIGFVILAFVFALLKRFRSSNHQPQKQYKGRNEREYPSPLRFHKSSKRIPSKF